MVLLQCWRYWGPSSQPPPVRSYLRVFSRGIQTPAMAARVAAMPPRLAPPHARPCGFMGRPAQTGMCAGSPAASRRVLPFGILLDVPIDTARGACTIQVGSYFTSETEVA